MRWYRPGQMRQILEESGMQVEFERRRHSSQSFYWFLRCIHGLPNENFPPVRLTWKLINVHHNRRFKLLEYIETVANLVIGKDLDPLRPQARPRASMRPSPRPRIAAVRALGARMSIEISKRALPSSAEMTERLAAWIERYRVTGASIAWMHGDEIAVRGGGRRSTSNTGVEVDARHAVPDRLDHEGLHDDADHAARRRRADRPRRARGDVSAGPALRRRRGDRAAVTIRQLLTHTSGVDGDFFEDFGRGDDCVAKYVAACAKLPQVFPSGTMWSYCNAGFVVLGRIIELMTGMTWDDALKTRILRSDRRDAHA